MLQTKTWLVVRRPCENVPPTRKPGCIRHKAADAAVCCRGSGRWSRGGRRPCRNGGTANRLSAYRSSCLRSSSRMCSTRAMSQLNRMSRSSSRCRSRLLFFGTGDNFSYRMSSVRRSRPAPPPPPIGDGGDGVGGVTGDRSKLPYHLPGAPHVASRVISSTSRGSDCVLSKSPYCRPGTPSGASCVRPAMVHLTR